jgi:hypothetical protein
MAPVGYLLSGPFLIFHHEPVLVNSHARPSELACYTDRRVKRVDEEPILVFLFFLLL